jgi:hypothetical protein
MKIFLIGLLIKWGFVLTLPHFVPEEYLSYVGLISYFIFKFLLHYINFVSFFQNWIFPRIALTLNWSISMHVLTWPNIDLAVQICSLGFHELLASYQDGSMR